MSGNNGQKPFPSVDRILAACLLILGLGVCLYLAWLPLEVSLSHFGFEDMFYYLQVARNLVQGMGPTLDGIHPTNGFHPLWMLVSAGLVSPFRPASETPVHLAFSLCAILHVLTAFLIYRLVFRTGNRWAALAALVFWLFNYSIVAIAMCGLEAALFGCLLVLTLSVYLVRRETLPMGAGVLIGILIGLTTLARFDGALFGFAVAGDQVLLWIRKKEPLKNLWARLTSLSVPAGLLMAPWLFWSMRISGGFLPHSHRALKLWIGRETVGGSSFIGRGLSLLGRYAPEAGTVYGIHVLWPVFLALTTVLFVLLLRNVKTFPGLPLFIFIIYPVAHASYYAANFVPTNRYLYPAHLIVFVGVMSAVAFLLKERRNERAIGLVAAALLVLMAMNIGTYAATSWQKGKGSSGSHSLHSTMYAQAVPWLRDHIPADAKIGSFNCGIFSYFSGRTVVNLDGVMNDSVIPALENRRLFSYLQDEQIEYIIDWEGMLDFAFTRYGGVDDYRSKFSIIKTFEQPWGPNKGARLLVLKLKDDANSANQT